MMTFTFTVYHNIGRSISLSVFNESRSFPSVSQAKAWAQSSFPQPEYDIAISLLDNSPLYRRKAGSWLWQGAHDVKESNDHALLYCGCETSNLKQSSSKYL